MTPSIHARLLLLAALIRCSWAAQRCPDGWEWYEGRSRVDGHPSCVTLTTVSEAGYTTADAACAALHPGAHALTVSSARMLRFATDMMAPTVAAALVGCSQAATSPTGAGNTGVGWSWSDGTAADTLAVGDQSSLWGSGVYQPTLPLTVLSTSGPRFQEPTDGSDASTALVESHRKDACAVRRASDVTSAGIFAVPGSGWTTAALLCELNDSDGDGVTDDADECPHSGRSAPEHVLATGCTREQVDWDRDGLCNHAGIHGNRFCSGVDNCPTVRNRAQTHTADADIGDACNTAGCSRACATGCDPIAVRKPWLPRDSPLVCTTPFRGGRYLTEFTCAAPWVLADSDHPCSGCVLRGSLTPTPTLTPTLTPSITPTLSATPTPSVQPWPMSGADPQQTGHSAVYSGPAAPAVLWTSPLLSGGHSVAHSGAAVSASNAVYYPAGPALQAVGAAGVLAGAFAPDPLSLDVASSPALSSDGATLFFALADVVYSVSAALPLAGPALWAHTVGAAVNCPPVLTPDGAVVIGDAAGGVTVLRPDTGAVVWAFAGTDAVYGLSVAATGRVFASTSVGIVALDSGSVAWTYTSGVSMYQATVSAGGVVAAPGVDGGVVGLSSSTGGVLWTHTQCASGGGTYNGYSSPLTALDTDQSLLYAACTVGADGALFAVDMDTGATVWQQTFAATGGLSFAPAVDASGTVFAVASNGDVSAVQGRGPGAPAVLWTAALPAARAPLALGASGRLYADNGDTVVVFG